MTPYPLPPIDNDTATATAIDTTDTSAPPGCGELHSGGGDRLPLKAVAVDADIVGLTATSRVRQLFVNKGSVAIEATYIFPLPPRAGVTDFSATLGGRRVVGTLKERGQARMEYEEALEASRRAAIVEAERSDVFTMRVGNLGPGEEAVVELVLTGPLEVQDGEATFRFPLVVAPRYTTGPPLSGDQTGSGEHRDTTAVPDASRVTPPRLDHDAMRPELAVTVAVDTAGLPFSDFRTSLHSTAVEDTGTGKTVVRLQPGDRADRDFVLRFRFDRTALGASAVVVVDDGAGLDEGTWSVTVIPPERAATEPRDVVVVLDRSGSMGGWKMVAARRAAGRIVDTLDIGDRFCVSGFDERIEHPAGCSALVEASDRNRFAAASWLGSLEARGGTEMAQALLAATHLLANSGRGRRPTLVLITDGQVTGEDHLLRSLEPSLGATTVHCVGVDRAVNAGFLDRLARQGKGSFHLVESEDRLDQVMGTLTRTIGRPSLTEITISGQDIDIVDTSITPSPIPDAFAGLPCVVSGRYRGRLLDQTTLTLTAVGASGPQGINLIPIRSDAAAVRTIWARAALADLEDAYYATGQRDQTGAVGRIVEHSIRYGVLSRFTAYVAVNPERTDADAPDEVIQPVETPSGWNSTRPRAAAGGRRYSGRSLASLSAYLSDVELGRLGSTADIHADTGGVGVGLGIELGDVSAATSGSPDLDLPIEDLDLSEHPRALLKSAHVHTVGELVLRSEDDLLKITGFGRESLEEVIRKLDECGLSLRSKATTLSGSVGGVSLAELLRDLEAALADPDRAASHEAIPILRVELEAARDTAEDRALQIALDRLCEALDTYVSAQLAPTKRDMQTVTDAIDSVRAAILARPEPEARSHERFWE